jgi:hypothetical protein
VICISGVPTAGIAAFRPRQRGNSSSGMVNLCDLPASTTRSRRKFDAAGDGAPEVTGAQPIDHDLTDPIERLAELMSATLDCFVLERSLKHCAAAPSCL